MEGEDETNKEMARQVALRISQCLNDLIKGESLKNGK